LLRCLLSVGAFALTGSAMAAPAADLAGYYRMPENSVVRPAQDGVVIVALYRCATDEFCGRIAARGGLPDADLRNPEPVSRARSLCGLDILAVEIPLGARDAALKGSLYDPRTGGDSAVELYAGSNGDLHVTEQPAPSGASPRLEEVWQRVTAPVSSCDRASSIS
jgi:hypothetical protein